MNVLTRKVLLLNPHYEAAGIIDVARATALVWKGKARVELPDLDYVLHSPTRTYEVPSVIVLKRYVNVRKRRNESGKKRFRIFVRDRFRCQYCCKRFPAFELTLDHIIPDSRNGSNDPDNLATSCKPCNQRKANRTPDEARMPLLATPAALRYGLDRALLRHYAEERPEWRRYLFLDEAAA